MKTNIITTTQAEATLLCNTFTEEEGIWVEFYK